MEGPGCSGPPAVQREGGLVSTALVTSPWGHQATFLVPIQKMLRALSLWPWYTSKSPNTAASGYPGVTFLHNGGSWEGLWPASGLGTLQHP